MARRKFFWWLSQPFLHAASPDARRPAARPPDRGANRLQRLYETGSMGKPPAAAVGCNGLRVGAVT